MTPVKPIFSAITGAIYPCHSIYNDHFWGVPEKLMVGRLQENSFEGSPWNGGNDQQANQQIPGKSKESFGGIQYRIN